MELDNFPSDIFESLWNLFYKMFDEEVMFSVKEVWNELKDSQESWQDYKDYFRDIDDKEQEYLNTFMSCDEFEAFIENGLKDNSNTWADPFLISCAMNKDNAAIITEENLNHKPMCKINHVCDVLNEKYGYNIKYYNLFDFLRHKNIKF